MAQTDSRKKANQYNDPKFSYLEYWRGRDYENAAEEIAIRRLLKGKYFKHAADIGGGYGRLCPVLKDFADQVTLVEPSQKQLDLAKNFLKSFKNIDLKLGQGNKLDFDDSSVDLLSMIRVMHHLPDPSVEFSELARVVSDDGYIILEVANLTHFQNRIKYLLKAKKMPLEPVDIRSRKNRKEDEVAFVNHNPRTVVRQLSHAGLKVEKTLSVSNLRSQALKKVMPLGLMVKAEKVMQPALAKSYFGPSVFFLVKKAQ